MMVTTGGRVTALRVGHPFSAAALEVGSRLLNDFRHLLVGFPSELHGDRVGSVEVDLLIDVGHDADLHQLADDLDGRRLELLSQLGNGQDRRQQLLARAPRAPRCGSRRCGLRPATAAVCRGLLHRVVVHHFDLRQNDHSFTTPLLRLATRLSPERWAAT